MKDFRHKFPDAKILVVDDYVSNQEVAKEFLELMECEVDTAGNGEEAIKMFKESNYNLIFMDIEMPEKSGYDTTKEIRKLDKKKGENIRIVALTAGAMSGDKEKCLEAGMDDYISKPVSGEDIEKMLLKHICYNE